MEVLKLKKPKVHNIIENPEKYYKVISRYPPIVTGNLLAFISYEMSIQGHTIFDILHIESIDGELYDFHASDFNVEVEETRFRDDIKQLANISRFVMVDDSMYIVMMGDGEYCTTHFHYVPPVKRMKTCKKSIKDLFGEVEC